MHQTFRAIGIMVRTICVYAVLGNLMTSSATAQEIDRPAPRSFVSQSRSGPRRLMTIQPESDGRISGTITQDNARFQFHGIADRDETGYTGTISPSDNPEKSHRFYLRRSGRNAIFALFYAGSSTDIDYSTEVVFVPERADIRGTYEPEPRDWRSGDDDRQIRTGSSYFERYALAGTYRGIRSELYLRRGTGGDDYIGRLYRNGSSYPVTVSGGSRLSAEYRDSRGNWRPLYASVPREGRIIVEIDGETESLSRDYSVSGGTADPGRFPGTSGSGRYSRGNNYEGTMRRAPSGSSSTMRRGSGPTRTSSGNSTLGRYID